MKYTDKDMIGYLKAVIITVICLLALSGANSNSGDNSMLESKLTSAIKQIDVRAILTPETTCVAIFLPIDKPEVDLKVIEKNKIALDSHLMEQRLKTLEKSYEVIIPYPQLHINFQLIPLRQDDPPDLS